MGQIAFATDKSSDACSVVSTETNLSELRVTAQLLGVSPEALQEVLTIRLIKTRDEIIRVHLSSTQANDARDALSKAVLY